MKTKLFLLGVVVSIWTVDVQAQPPGPRGDGGGPPQNPIFGALDADGDHEITFDEISQAVAMLKEQDTNGDKKLTGDEMTGILGPGAGRGAGGHGAGGPGRGGPRGDSGMAERLMGFDKNKDGKLATDEVPERMQRLIKNADTDKDGFVDKDELTAVTAKMRGDGDQAGRAGARGDRDRYGRGTGGPGGRDQGGRGGPGGRRPFGAPNPEMMVQHAFEFDADKDGLLSKTELAAFAKEMGKNRRQGGGRPDRGGRPGRPQRPE